MKTLIRLPNWLGDLMMSFPVARAIARKFPQTSFIGMSAYKDLLKVLNIDTNFIALPPKNWHYFFHFFKYSGQFDQIVLFTNSQRSDIESFFISAPDRYGISWHNRPRWLLNHRFPIIHPEQDNNRHQTQLLADFTAHFALHDGISFETFFPQQTGNGIVLICGSENYPAKRWSVEHWRTLLDFLLLYTHENIIFCGTKNDIALIQEITAPFNAVRIQNLAGKTTLSEFAHILRQARLVVGNDTGGLHLANALAVPTIGLYGPTNPQRTAPIYQAPLIILQPPDCPPTGGKDMALLEAERVISAVKKLLMTK